MGDRLGVGWLGINRRRVDGAIDWLGVNGSLISRRVARRGGLGVHRLGVHRRDIA